MSDLIRARPTPWKTVILLCGKCARKMDGGCGSKGKDTLRTVLRDALRLRGHRRDVLVIAHFEMPERIVGGIWPHAAISRFTLCTVPEPTPTILATLRMP
jgi:hypothetical protein